MILSFYNIKNHHSNPTPHWQTANRFRTFAGVGRISLKGISFMERLDSEASGHFTPEGLVRFLSSSFVKGVGPVYARKITDKYSFDIFSPDFDWEATSCADAGLPEKSFNDLKESLSNLKVDSNGALLLFSAGLSDTEAEKILAHYGRNTLAAILEDPYDMVENVWKVSFFTADKIGQYLGIAADDPRRLRGALLTAVKYYAEKGSLFADEIRAVKTAAALAGTDEEKVAPQLEALVTDERLVRSSDGIYLPVYYNAEKDTAGKLAAIIRNSEPADEDYKIPETDIDGNPLNEGQIEALKTVLRNPITVITGGPGTGKTTAVRGIIRLFEDMERKVVLVAPTGRAAKRLSDLAGSEAKTIHRLLGYSMGKGYRNKRLDAGILVIDEASMLEQVIFNHLLDALDYNIKIVLVGDTNQLPAIGAGDVLNDLIKSGSIPVVRLTENFRQKAGSQIAATAEAIKRGISPERGAAKDFILAVEKNPKDILDTVLELVADAIPRDFGVDPKDIQVVSPQQDGMLGAREMNVLIQRRVNPDGPALKTGARTLRLGDRVMQTANSAEHGIYNGETGWISAVNEELGYLDVTFHDGKIIRYGKERLKELSLAYATTVHKLQGSETDYMVMVLSGIHRNLLYRNLLYTGVSRARKLCVLVGEEKAIETAMRNEEPAVRNSNLRHRLRHALIKSKNPH